MPEPSTIAGGAVLERFQRILDARGLGHITAGPTDNQPNPDEPGHPAFHRRQRTEIALRRWATATPYRYQQATATHPAILGWVGRVIDDPRTAGSLFLTGPFGTGKTHEAYGALRRVAEAGPDRFEVMAVTAPDLYALLRPGGSERGAEYELRRLATVPLLLVDDLGTEKISEFTEEATYRLLNERYNHCHPLIITSNLPAFDPNGVDLVDKLGERIASRLAQITTVVAMEGADRRRQAGGAA
ncbi:MULTISPECIES: ATP-binding protein [unclassified Streptomyces]|uniref:ATP-binding protein n=1 Tax=unclassified Streptomyces TaxID=2593676 RepID=UPI0003737D4D|nr:MULTISPECIES: ATP-binding protein [unclassified Streptomyces]MYX33442.1 ATP-binding protein [Streptomyces sp. SID8377]